LVKAVSDGSARESTMSPKRSEDVPSGSRAAVVAKLNVPPVGPQLRKMPFASSSYAWVESRMGAVA
jgi:hypothetical protein